VWGSYSRAVYKRVQHKGAKHFGHEIPLIFPDGYTSMRLNTYILVCKIQKLFIYEDLWSHRDLGIYLVAIIPDQIKGRASRASPRGANLYGTLRRLWKNQIYCASILRFSTRDRISQKIILKSGHVPCKRFASPVLEE
jgi:hypothetical protein